MKVTELKTGYLPFGNKGSLWSKKAHIMKSGLHSTTLCGVPMLSHNYCEGVVDIGCEMCIKEYNKLNNEQLQPSPQG